MTAFVAMKRFMGILLLLVGFIAFGNAPPGEKVSFPLEETSIVAASEVCVNSFFN